MTTKERSFRHLTFTQRLQIEAYLRIGTTMRDIASLVGVHLATVYREIKRGSYMRRDGQTWLSSETYSPDIAEKRYRSNLLAKGAPLKIGKDYALAEYIENRILQSKYSPSAVLGEIRHKGLSFSTSICKSTLYSYIAKGVFLRLSLADLPLKNVRKKHNRKLIASKPPRGTSIERRPSDIRQRSSFGHWEMDCVCGPTLPTLLVLSERLTRKEIIMPMPNQKADSVITCLNSIQRSLGSQFERIFKTITVDNGSEFSNYKGLEYSLDGKRRTSVYYCHPYCSCERGTNERLNREIRRLIPKGSDLSKFSPEDIARVEDWVNNYPRQVLGFATSSELFAEQLSKLQT